MDSNGNTVIDQRESKVYAKLDEVIFKPVDLTKFERFRKFFDLSLYNWFIPGCALIIAILATCVAYIVAVNVEDYTIRVILIFAAALIIVAALVAVAIYHAQTPLDTLLGTIVEQRYVSNVLGGIYFGTQVARWTISLYFYQESAVEPQISPVLRLLFICVITLCFISCIPIVWEIFMMMLNVH